MAANNSPSLNAQVAELLLSIHQLHEDVATRDPKQPAVQSAKKALKRLEAYASRYIRELECLRPETYQQRTEIDRSKQLFSLVLSELKGTPSAIN